MQTPAVALTPLKRTPLFVLSLAGLIFLGALWGFYSSDAAVKARERDDRLAAAQDAGPVRAAPTLEVETLRLSSEPGIQLVELSGVLEPIRSTWVAAETSGRIIEIGAAEHAPVSAGDLLVRLDSALPEAELIRAKANHQLAKDELERQQRLGSRSVASQAELDRARAEERRSYAALLEARTRLSHTRIEAPFDGLVNSLDLDPGAYVQPGTRIAEILDLSSIEVTVTVSDRQVGAIKVGAIATVRIDPLGNQITEGRVVRVGGAPQAETQRFPVVVELANPDGKLLPGMLAHVRLEIGQASSIRVPSGAVLHEFELDYVFVLDEENATYRKRVSTRPVPFRPDQIEIRDGLQEGDRIATTAVSQLRDGLRVIAR
jgi:membrane fusion protein (multidrug efflux system)